MRVRIDQARQHRHIAEILDWAAGELTNGGDPAIVDRHRPARDWRLDDRQNPGCPKCGRQYEAIKSSASSALSVANAYPRCPRFPRLPLNVPRRPRFPWLMPVRGIRGSLLLLRGAARGVVHQLRRTAGVAV